MSEKTEKATPWSLQKAKEQGQVSKSAELNTCVFLLIMLGVAMALGPSTLFQLKQLITHLLYLTTHLPFSVDTVSQLHQFLLSNITALWLPFALAGMLSIMLSTIAQTGFVWSGKPLVPDVKRLDLSKGFKRLCSTKLLFDAGKGGLKLSFTVFVLLISLKHELPTLTAFMRTSPELYPSLLIALLSKVILQLLVILFALAFLDTLYTRWKFGQDHRMSKQEVKDEYRQREGDPKIKAKIKQLQHQLRQKTTSLEHVKTADVVITSSTLLAVVLKYDRGLMPAPQVVCKAQGDLVKQVKRLAHDHHVAIIENKALAEILFAALGLNQWIHRDHFPKVAALFRDIYRQKAIS